MMLMVPILALLFFVVTQILEKVHSLKELHAIGSQGEHFGTKLFEQRLRTNKKVEELKSSIKEFTGKEFGAEFQQALNLAMHQLDLIGLYRDKVDAVPLWVYEVIDHYTEVNNSLFLLIEHLKKFSPNAEISNLLAAYINFLRGKDKEGIERALLSNAFANDRFVADGFRRFVTVNAEQESYFQVFLSFATARERGWYNTIVRGQAVDEVAQIRQMAFDNDNEGNLGIDPDHWFKVATEKINLLKDVEEKMSKSLLVETDRLKSEGRHTLIFVSIMGASVVFLSMFLAYVLSRRILTPIADLRRATSV